MSLRENWVYPVDVFVRDVEARGYTVLRYGFHYDPEMNDGKPWLDALVKGPPRDGDLDRSGVASLRAYGWEEAADLVRMLGT